MTRAWLCAALCAAAAALLVSAAPAAAQYVAPDPGGNEAANLPVPVPGKYYGNNEDIVDFSHHQSPDSYAAYAEYTGANVVKTSLEWWRVERFKPDEYVQRRWNVWEDAYDALRAKGITPLFILSAAPCWARSPVCEPSEADPVESLRYPPTPQYDDEWAEFVADVARRFPEAILQVWNEPNLAFYWRPAPDPERYAELLDVAYEAVQGVEAELEAAGGPGTVVEIPVIGPGLANHMPECGDGLDNEGDGQRDFHASPGRPADSDCTDSGDDSEGTTGPTDAHLPMRVFLNRAYAAPHPMAQNFDALAVNLFPHSYTYGQNTLLAESFEQIRAARTTAGDTKPIYISETGLAAAAIPHPDSVFREYARAVLLVALYNRLLTMPDVGMVVFHRIIEPKDSNFVPLESDYAWLRYDPPADPEVPQAQAPGLPEPKWVFCRFTDLANNSYPRCLEPTITTGTNGSTKTRQHTFSFVKSANYFDPAGFECRLNDAPYLPCTSPYETSILADGNYTFAVRAKDAESNASAPAERSFRVDNIGPTTTIDTPANGTTTPDRTPTATFSANEPGVTFECAVSPSTSYGPCSGPAGQHTTGVLTDGTYTLAVRATDDAGNVGGNAFAGFTVNGPDPDTAITKAVVSARRRTAKFTFTGSGGADPLVFQCRLDSRPFKSCTSIHTLSRLRPGRHTFRVRAIDEVAGADLSPAKKAFRIPR